jgi:uncharacterized protein YndB with AHSA1/START domain
MTPQPQQRQFEIEVPIAAPREDVWRAISEADGLANWFAYHAEVVPGAGGRVLWEWPGLHSWPLRIEAWKPGEALRLSYPSAVDDGRGGKVPLFVDFELTGAGGTTTLRLVHHGFGPQASFDGEYDGIRTGWPAELASLKHYLERHRGRERMLAHAQAYVGGTIDDGWRALCSARGLGARSNLDASKPGDRVTLALEGAEAMSGVVLTRSDTFHGRTVRVESLDDAFLHVWCEPGPGKPRAWIGLALYEGSRERVDRYQRAFDALFARLFATQAVAGKRA